MQPLGVIEKFFVEVKPTAFLPWVFYIGFLSWNGLQTDLRNNLDGSYAFYNFSIINSHDPSSIEFMSS